MRGEETGGERRPTRGGSVAARVVAGSGVAGFGGWQPGWKHANDPLIPSRDIGPLTHASAGDPSGAASNMPSQLFDSTHNLCFSLFLSLSLSPSVSRALPRFFLRLSPSFSSLFVAASCARLSSSFSFLNRTCLPSHLSRSFPDPMRLSIFGRCFVLLFLVSIDVSLVCRLSFTFPFYSRVLFPSL